MFRKVYDNSKDNEIGRMIYEQSARDDKTGDNDTVTLCGIELHPMQAFCRLAAMYTDYDFVKQAGQRLSTDREAIIKVTDRTDKISRMRLVPSKKASEEQVIVDDALKFMADKTAIDAYLTMSSAETKNTIFAEAARIVFTASAGLANSRVSATYNLNVLYAHLVYYYVASRGYVTPKVLYRMTTSPVFKVVKHEKSISELTFDEYMQDVYSGHSRGLETAAKAMRFMLDTAFSNKSEYSYSDVCDLINIVKKDIAAGKPGYNILTSYYTRTSGIATPIVESLLGEKCAIAVQAAYSLIGEYQLCMTSDEPSLIHYFLKRYTYGEKDSNKYKLAMLFTRKILDLQTAVTRGDVVEFLSAIDSGARAEALKGLKEVDDTKRKLSEQYAKLDRYKTKIKTVESEVKDKQREIRELKKQVEQLSSSIDSGINLEMTRKLEDDNSRLSAELKKANAELTDANRQLRKANDELSGTQDKLSKAVSDLKDADDKLKKEKTFSQELSIHRSFSEIPIECFVNAITDKNIVLIGGNMMYEALNGYGFKNLRFKPAQSRDTTYQDISDTDLVIISTAYSDHATTETAMGIIRKHNIPFMYFNNKSAEMLVHEIFKKFYSE